MAYVPTTTHVTLLATLQRERMLPAPGEVSVQEQQRVDSTTVLAQATVAKHHRLVEIAHKLGVPPRRARKTGRKGAATFEMLTPTASICTLRKLRFWMRRASSSLGIVMTVGYCLHDYNPEV